MVKKKSKIKKIFAALSSLFIFGTVGGNIVGANMTTVDPDNVLFNQKQALIQQQNAKGGAVSEYSSNAGDRFHTTIKPINTKDSRPQRITDTPDQFSSTFGINDSKYSSLKTNSSGPWQDYFFEIDNPIAGDTVTVTYPKVGKFDDKEIDATVTFGGFQYSWMPEEWASPRFDEARNAIPKNKIMINVPANFWGAIFFGNTKKTDVSIVYKYSDSKEVIDLTNTNSFTTIGSLNVNEFSTYNNIDMKDKDQIGEYVFASSDTTVVYTNEASKNYNGWRFQGTAPGGDQSGNSNNDFTDWVGGATYARSAVAYKAIGKSQKFTIGQSKAARVAFTISGASIGIPPREPEKQAVDPITGKEVDATKISPGQQLEFKIKQRVHSLNGEILQKYKEFYFGDRLPKELEYVSAKFLDPSGKDILKEAGEIKVTPMTDGSERTEVRFVGNANFMNNICKYEQETYTLVLTTKVREDLGQDAHFENLAFSRFSKETPGVSVVTYEKNKIEKFVRHLDKEVQEKEIELAKGEKEFAYDFNFQVTDDPLLQLWTFRDDLESPLTFKSIQFFNDKNEDVTANFVRNMERHDNEIEYTAKPEYVNSMINQKLKAIMTVAVKDDYDLSQFKDGKIPNTAKVITNFDTTESNKVHVKPSDEQPVIVKHFLNEKGEAANDVEMVNNTDPILAVGRFTVTNKAEKDYKVESVVVKEPLDPALEFRNEKEDVLIKDDKDQDVTKEFDISTEDNGQTVLLTAKKDYVQKMVGRTYKIERIRLYYRLGTDLSQYKDGKIPNHFDLVVNGESTPSETVTVKPKPESSEPVKSILNEKGEKVAEYQMKKADEVITYAMNVLVPNDIELTDMSIVDKLDNVYEFKQFVLYKDETKKEMIFDSSKDKKTKDIFSVEGQVVKYEFEKENLQEYANASLYAEMKVKVKKDADLSKLENGKIPNKFDFIVNGETKESNTVIVTPEGSTNKITKSIFFDGKEVESLEKVEKNQPIPYKLHVELGKNTPVKKLLIHDNLDQRLMTSESEINKAQVIKDGKDVSSDFILEYNVKENRVVVTLKEEALPNYQNGQSFDVLFNAMLADGVKMSSKENIPNTGTLFINDDPTESNKVVVIPNDEDPAKPNEILKKVWNEHDQKWLDGYTYDTLIYSDSKDEKERKESNGYVSDDNGRLKFKYQIESVVNEVVTDKVVVSDKIQDGLTPAKVSVYANKDNQQKEITEKSEVNIEGQMVTVMIPKSVYDALDTNKIDVVIDTLLSEDLSKDGERLENSATIQVDDREPTTSNTTNLNPKKENPVDPISKEEATPKGTEEVQDSGKTLPQTGSKKVVSIIFVLGLIILLLISMIIYKDRKSVKEE